MKKLLIFLSLLGALETGAQVTNSLTNYMVTGAKLTNYVRSSLNPNQFNTNSFPYTLTNSTSKVTFLDLQFSSTATTTGTITPTGYTNTNIYSVNIWYDATNSTVTNFNGSGNPIRTNIGMSGSGLLMELQAGGKQCASGGLQGTWNVK